MQIRKRCPNWVDVSLHLGTWVSGMWPGFYLSVGSFRHLPLFSKQPVHLYMEALGSHRTVMDGCLSTNDLSQYWGYRGRMWYPSEESGPI